MRLTVLGAWGAWPDAGEACSGYLVGHDGFRLLLDLGYSAHWMRYWRWTAPECSTVRTFCGSSPRATISVSARSAPKPVCSRTPYPTPAYDWSPTARVLPYTGDTGPSREVVALARGADLLLAGATYVDQVPEDSRRHLSSAYQAGLQAAEAGARHLVLTHLQPGTDPRASRAAAGDAYDGRTDVAAADLVHDLP